jgi:hypothetical protein
LIWHTHMQRKSTTSINMHGNLTFMKHIYIDVNIVVIVVRQRFVQ